MSMNVDMYIIHIDRNINGNVFSNADRNFNVIMIECKYKYIFTLKFTYENT